MKIYDDIFVLRTFRHVQRVLSQTRELSKCVSKLAISQSLLYSGRNLLIAVWICAVRLALVKP